MPSDLYPSAGHPDLSRWETLARRIVWAAAAGAGLVTLIGMGTSFAGLRWTYLGAGFPTQVASVAPLIVDLLTLVAYVGLLVLPGKLYPSAVLAAGVLLSAGAQGYHARHGGIAAPITDGRLIFVLGASFMIFAGLALHLLWKILERALPADFITAMRGVERKGDPVTAPMSVPAVRQGGDFPDVDALREPWTHKPPQVEKPQLSPPRALRAVAQPTRTQALDQAQNGPCAAGCEHHAGVKVGKSTRYRCQNTLQGKRDDCPACVKTREARSA
jgi:hypothetical protein